MNGRLQRGVIILPSALTLANLFFGVWAIVAASRGEFTSAAWLVVWAAIADTLDGRVARVTGTGSRFGSELDSLVDAISFGVAPGLIIYHTFLTEGIWGWVASYLYIVSAVVRLARFNIEQAGHAKVAFHGLPSPAAGITLATFYPFSQTDFFKENLAHFRWPVLITALMLFIGMLMMSHVLYPVMPKFGFRNRRGITNLIFILGVTACAITIPAIFFFPFGLLYIAYGLVKAVMLGMFERLPERDPMLDEDIDEADAEVRDIDYGALTPPHHLFEPRRRRRRRRRPPMRGPE